MITTLLALSVSIQAQSFSLLDRPVLPFKATTLNGRSITEASFRGKTNVFFVFCSCIECRRVAEDWTSIRNKGTLSGAGFKSKIGPAQATVVYIGERAEAAKFAKDFALSPSATVADPDALIARTYRAMPCPTVYLVDPKGIVRYASKEIAGELVSDSDILVGQTLSALRHLVSKPNTRVVTKAELPIAGPQLTPMMSADVTLSDKADIAWNVTLSQGRPFVKRRFTFVNKSKKAIEIEHLLTSCGCQKAALVFGGKEVRTAKVPPGRGLIVDVEVALPEGLDSKTVSVWLYTKAVTPAGSIRITVSKGDR